MTHYYQITFYVPQEQREEVKEAMFQAGAGKLDNYEACSWQVLGEGQFRPMEGSKPFLGETNKLEKVLEYKVEMLCVADKLETVIKALKNSHPYEVPAYGVLALVDV